MKTSIFRRGLALCMIFCITLGCASCGGGAAAATMFLRKTEGVVDISDEDDKKVTLRENMGLYSGYTVGTESASYAWIDLDKVKLAKLDENSKAEITKDGKYLAIDIISGSLFFNVTEPLAEDETMEIRTSSMLVGIRGTCGWVELTQSGSLQVSILEGAVACSVTGADGQVQTAEVSGGQTAELSVDASGQPRIDVQTFREIDVRSFVLEEVTDDSLLCDKIEQASSLQLLGFTEPPPLARYCLGNYADYQMSSKTRNSFSEELYWSSRDYDAAYAVLFNAGNGVTGLLAAVGNNPTVNEQGYVQLEGGRVWISLSSEERKEKELYTQKTIQLFDDYALLTEIFGHQGYSSEKRLLTDGSLSYGHVGETLPFVAFTDENLGQPKTSAQTVAMWLEQGLRCNGEMPQAFVGFYSTYWLIDPSTGVVYPAESQEDWDTCIVLDGLFPIGDLNEGMRAALEWGG